MFPTDRRAFLGASAGALASALAAGPTLLARDVPPPRTLGDSSGLDTVFLTWHRDPTTTMVVQWVGVDAPAELSVRYVSKTGTAWATAKVTTKPFPQTERKVFRAELTGLTQDTEYLFQIGKDAKTYRFRTMPAKATDTFTFVSGGDCGTNIHAVNNNILAAKQEPYFALIGGDLGYDNGTSPKTAVAFLQNYSKHMVDAKGRMIPMVCCIGNHEVAGGYGKKRADAPFFLAMFDGLFADTTYATLDFGDYLSLVLLDTGHVSPIGGDQADWLDGALSDRAERPHLIVANHVPAYPSFRNPATGAKGEFGTGEGNRLHWVPLFEKHNVDVVLEHHDHTFKRTHPLKDGLVDKNGVVYLGDGSWGQIRAPAKPEKRPYLAVTSRAYHMTVHRLEGEQRFHIAMEETGRLADVCATAGKRPRRRG